MTAPWLPAPLLDANPRVGLAADDPPVVPPRDPDAVVRRSELGSVAWQVLVHDGAVVALTDEVGVPRGTPVRPVHRAAALPERPAKGRAVCGAAAVWVHTGGPCPDLLDTCLPAASGRTSPGGVVVLAGSPVLDPVGTAVELLRLVPLDLARPLVDRLRTHAGVDLGAAWLALAAWSNRRGIRQAEAALRALMAQEPDGQCRTGVSPALAPVIRYTSNTPSTLRTADSTEARCEGSAISNTNRDIATRSREVDTEADRMLT
jgi:hypothetical protein